jgi:hypothetical protein
MNATELYRVVGVRADKSRVMICEGTTKPQAEHARHYLLDSNMFVWVEIELVEQSSPELDVRAGKQPA